MVDVLSLAIPTPTAIEPDKFATDPADASPMLVICVLPLDFSLTLSDAKMDELSSTSKVALFSVTEIAATKAAPTEFDCDTIVLCVTAELSTVTSPLADRLVPSSMIISDCE